MNYFGHLMIPSIHRLIYISTLNLGMEDLNEPLSIMPEHLYTYLVMYLKLVVLSDEFSFVVK